MKFAVIQEETIGKDGTNLAIVIGFLENICFFSILESKKIITRFDDGYFFIKILNTVEIDFLN